MIKLSFKAGLLSLALGLTVSASSAADIVFDPSNFAKNSITAAQQVKQTAHQAAILAEEIRQYQMMVQDLKQINPSVVAQGIARGIVPPGVYSSNEELARSANGVYDTHTKIINNMQGYESTYGSLNKTLGDLDNVAYGANVAPSKVLMYDYIKAEQGVRQDKNYYKSLNDLVGQLDQHKKRTDLLAAELPTKSGTVELLQVLGSQNTLVQDQLSQLIQVTTINANKSIENSLAERNKIKWIPTKRKLGWLQKLEQLNILVGIKRNKECVFI
jgi:P-type conjugative transfer protein TrbJ